MQIVDKKKQSWLFCEATGRFFVVLLAAVIHHSQQVLGADERAQG